MSDCPPGFSPFLENFHISAAGKGTMLRLISRINLSDMKQWIFLIGLIASSAVTLAQTGSVRGSLIDKDQQTNIQGATLLLLRPTDSTRVQETVSDKQGRFQFNQLDSGNYIVSGTMIGFRPFTQKITVGTGQTTLNPIKLEPEGKELGSVVVVSQVPIVQKADTTQYSASQYKVNPDATTEDLVKKMPGITVDKDGTVTAHGEQVKKLTIDGKDFFGDDVSAALKNLPSEVVDKIQVFDRLSDQAQLTGFDDGNTQKSINIVTKNGIRNGQFGRVYAGYGTDDRYAAGGNVSFFQKNRRISIVGNFNNINQQNFGSQDLLGVSSASNTRGGGGFGGGRSGGRPGGSSDNFQVGQSSGISRTNALGINFSNTWSPKLSLTGSYFFNNSRNNNDAYTNTVTFGSKNLNTVQSSNALTDNFNHRINLRLEYKMDSSNTLIITPSLNFQKNKSTSYGTAYNYYSALDSLNNSITNSVADKNGYNIRNNVMFRHSFAKKGRTLAIGLNTTFTKNDGTTTTEADYRFFNNGLALDSLQNQFYDNNANGYTLGANLAYTEPLSKNAQLQIEYNPSYQKNKADQQTFLFDGQKYSILDTTLSNKFDNTVVTHNGGVSYRYNPNKDEMLMFGVNYQYSTLSSDRVFPTVSKVNQPFSNLLPNAMWRKKLSARSNFRLFYRASTNFPSVTQLQDVVNLSNPLRVSVGNPALEQAYTHTLGGRYMFTNTKTSRSFFANIFLQTTANYISNATYIAAADSSLQPGVVLKRGSQLTKPVNLNGYNSLRSFFTYSTPIKKLKTTVNLNAGLTYSRLPGQVNYVNTFTNNYVYNAGVVLASNISQYVDFNINYNVNFNQANTSISSSTDNNYTYQSFGAVVNLLNKKGWFIQNDVSNQSYTGLTGGLNTSFWLWNASIGKKFLKKQAGELKLSVFDLLKQNQSVTRTVTETYIQDAQSAVLQQYFMLTFTYSLKNFGKAASRATRPSNNEPGMPMGMPPGGPGQMGGGMMGNPGL